MKSTKRVFISHSSKDNYFAERLAQKIEEKYGREAFWIDLFDLDAGSSLANVIPTAIQEANTFILLASQASMASRWVRYEASLATFLNIERENYQIVVVKLDNCEFPHELSQLRMYRYLDGATKLEETFDEVVSLIAKDGTRPLLKRVQEPFVGRGEEQDKLEYAASRHKIIYLIGIPGIGKASLIRRVVSTRLNAELIQIDVKLSHDMQLLTRQIIALCGLPQPKTDTEEDELLTSAIWALKSRIKDGVILFINNVQNSMNSEGAFRSYLQKFLETYVNEDIDSPLFLASTRRPEFAVQELIYTTPITIGPLTTKFMSLAVQRWYEFINVGAPSYSETELYELVNGLGGYPLAAKLVASELTYQSPNTLAQKTSVHSVQRSIAEFILGKISAGLDEVDRQVLYTLAIYDARVSTRYLLANEKLKMLGQQEVEASIKKLSRLLLITQNIDSFELHPFIAAYFVDEASDKGEYKEIANNLADVSLLDTKNLIKQLDKFPQNKRRLDNKHYVNFSRALLETAAPTYRLLFITGREKETKQLPYRLRGHIREMVFIAYERSKDYRSCIEYAKQWLAIDVEDAQVRLYMARAYERLEQYDEAERLLNQLEYKSTPTMRAQIYRERGRIAYQQDLLEEAIEHYEAGQIRRRDGSLYYAQINVDYARALIAKASRLWDMDPVAKRLYQQAADLLDEARPNVARFDQVNLDLYAFALLRADRIKRDEAVDMLTNALEFQRNDGKIHMRLAELLSEDITNLPLAMSYAIRAKELNAYGSILTIAKIMINQGKNEQAIRELSRFEASLDKDIIVADVLRARALSNLGKHNEAKNIVSQYGENQYAVIAMLQIILNAGFNAVAERQYSKAKQCLVEANRTAKQLESLGVSHGYLDKHLESLQQLKNYLDT